VSEDDKNSAASSSLYAGFTQKNQAHFIPRVSEAERTSWKSFFSDLPTSQDDNAVENGNESFIVKSSSMGLYKELDGISVNKEATLLQINNTFILAPVGSGFIMVHQQLAHERVLYEKYQKASNQPHATQKSLFPVVLDLSVPDAILLEDMIEDLAIIGYEIAPFGQNSFIIQGIPADVISGNEKNAIELLLEQFKHFSGDIKFSKREKLIRCLARQSAIKAGQSMSQEEMHSLIESLFNCETPTVSASGAPTYIDFKEAYLDNLFSK